jgi:hypothetical protein
MRLLILQAHLFGVRLLVHGEDHKFCVTWFTAGIPVSFWEHPDVVSTDVRPTERLPLIRIIRALSHTILVLRHTYKHTSFHCGFCAHALDAPDSVAEFFTRQSLVLEAMMDVNFPWAV